VTAITLTRMRLSEGIWEGLLAARSEAPPALLVRHDDRVVAEPETENTGRGGWLVRFRLPVDRLSDGIQTFVIEDAETGDALAHETIIAGEVLDEDVRAEVSLLRAEIDMLKRAFRRHCADS